MAFPLSQFVTPMVSANNFTRGYAEGFFMGRPKDQLTPYSLKKILVTYPRSTQDQLMTKGHELSLQKQSLTLSLNRSVFRFTQFFNRIAVEKEDDIRIMHFGYQSSQGFLMNVLSIAISEIELKTQEKSLTNYLRSAGALGDFVPWIPPVSERPIHVCNLINMSRTGSVGEIVLHNFSRRMAKEVEEKASIEAIGIALLRSRTDLQKHLIRLLFSK
ncbi:MAG: hypothetical protein WCO94_11880 [Verrucomicrobiota bacterium]